MVVNAKISVGRNCGDLRLQKVCPGHPFALQHFTESIYFMFVYLKLTIK